MGLGRTLPDLRVVIALAAAGLSGCAPAPVESVRAAAPVVEEKPAPVAPALPETSRVVIRATGTVQAVRSVLVQVPQITGQDGRVVLATLIPNGTDVKEGDVLAEFDRTKQMDLAREAQAKFEDLNHQIEQKKAQNQSDSEKRASDLREAEADLAKAALQLRRGPLLSDIDRLKNEVKHETANARVASLQKSGNLRDQAEAAALRVLELQRDRQKVSLERSQANAEKLLLKARLAGMVSLENVWRGGTMGPAQEGDQLWPGQGLMRIFDPSEMRLICLVNEPDGAALKPGTRARVWLDAYPELAFDARFESASPVASSGIGTPIKNFSATFRLEQKDRHLLPDLSAAVEIEVPR
jgi:HlyD family secretion protein